MSSINEQKQAQQQSTTAPLGSGSPASINEPMGSTLGANAPGGGVAPPALDIESLDPEEATIGDADLTMHVHGVGFTPDCVIVFNGGEEPTVFVSPNELTTGVKPSLVGAPIVVPVFVKNAGTQTDALEFEFLASEPVVARKRTVPRRR